MSNLDMTVGQLKEILNQCPDEMFVCIPVIDECDVNRINGFRLIRTAGILFDDREDDDRQKVLCLNGSADTMNIRGQVRYSGRDVLCERLLFPGEPKKGE